MDPRPDDPPGEAGLERRRFLALGGLTLAATAVLAACGDDDEDNIPSAGLPSPTTGLPERRTDDIVLLRTASSLEHSAVAVYDALVPLLPDDLAAIATTFRDHHETEAASFESLTTEQGGEAFSEPNPAWQTSVIEPTLELIDATSDADIQVSQAVTFAHAIETTIASTYQSFMPILTQAELREATMSVGAVTARHSAVWAGQIDGSQPVAGLDTFSTAPSTVPPTTTTQVAGTVAGATTTTTSPALALPPDGVFQVPRAFGSLAEALGPNSYIYDERTETTTEEG